MEAPAFAVLVEPAAEARPFAEQRLVRDLQRSLAHRQQTRIREDGYDARSGLVSLEAELVDRDAAPSHGALVAGGEPEHDRASHLLLGLAQLAVGFLGETRHRPTDAARAAIGLVAEKPPVAKTPELEQRRREQR